MRNARLPISLGIALSFAFVFRDAAAQDGAAFLKIPIGAQAVGMGEAATAQTSGADALNWNVAGIANTPVVNGGRTASLSVSHQSLFSSGSQLDQAGATAPLGRLTLGLNVIRLSYGSSEARDDSGAQTGSAQAEDLSGGIAGAYNFGAFQVGTQIKIVHQQLADASAQTTAFDVGFLSRTPIANLSFGGSAQNLGSEMKFEKESFSLPAMLSFGGAYRMPFPVMLTADIRSHLHNKNIALAMGAELQMATALTLRAGYLSTLTHSNTANGLGTGENTPLGIGGLTGGLGLKLKQFSLDYAMEPFGELGTAHLFTLSANFGGGRSPTASSMPSPEKQDDRRLDLDIKKGL